MNASPWAGLVTRYCAPPKPAPKKASKPRVRPAALEKLILENGPMTSLEIMAATGWSPEQITRAAIRSKKLHKIRMVCVTAEVGYIRASVEINPGVQAIFTERRKAARRIYDLLLARGRMTFDEICSSLEMIQNTGKNAIYANPEIFQVHRELSTRVGQIKVAQYALKEDRAG